MSANGATKERKKVSQVIMEVVSGIMLPCMSALVGCGLVSALCTILRLCGLIAEGSGTYQVLYGIGQTCLYFFPVIVGSSAAKFFGMDAHIGAIIGASLMYPSFVAAAEAGEVTAFLGFIPLTWTNYSSTVLPAIVAVWFGSVVYKWLDAHVPDVLKLALVNFGTILITVPIALLAIGPFTNMVGNALSQATMFIYNLSPVVCGIVLGAVWQMFLIPLGLHWGFVAVVMNNLVTLGKDPIMGLVCAGVTMTGTLLAVGIKAKKPQTKALAFSTAVTNFCGISEPGLFGIALLHKQTIIATSVAYAATGAIAALFHVFVFNMGASGIFAIPNYLDPSGNMSSVIGAVICQVVGIALSFAITMIMPFDPDEGVEAEDAAEKD